MNKFANCTNSYRYTCACMQQDQFLTFQFNCVTSPKRVAIFLNRSIISSDEKMRYNTSAETVPVFQVSLVQWRDSWMEFANHAVYISTYIARATNLRAVVSTKLECEFVLITLCMQIVAGSLWMLMRRGRLWGVFGSNVVVGGNELVCIPRRMHRFSVFAAFWRINKK